MTGVLYFMFVIRCWPLVVGTAEVLLRVTQNMQLRLGEILGKTFIAFLSLAWKKRRSNRQVKRKKYSEEGEGKQSEEEAAKVSVKIKKNSAPLPAEQPLQLFVVSKNLLGLWELSICLSQFSE